MKPSGKGSSSFRGAARRSGARNRGGNPRDAGFGKNPKREWKPKVEFQSGSRHGAHRDSSWNRHTGCSESPNFRRRNQEKQQQQQQHSTKHQQYNKKWEPKWEPKYHR